MGTPYASFENPRYTGARDVSRVGLNGTKHEIIAATVIDTTTTNTNQQSTGHPGLHMQRTNHKMSPDDLQRDFRNVPQLEVDIVEGKRHLEVQQTAPTTFTTRGG